MILGAAACNSFPAPTGGGGPVTYTKYQLESNWNNGGYDMNSSSTSYLFFDTLNDLNAFASEYGGSGVVTVNDSNNNTLWEYDGTGNIDFTGGPYVYRLDSSGTLTNTGPSIDSFPWAGFASAAATQQFILDPNFIYKDGANTFIDIGFFTLNELNAFAAAFSGGQAVINDPNQGSKWTGTFTGSIIYDQNPYIYNLSGAVSYLESSDPGGAWVEIGGGSGGGGGGSIPSPTSLLYWNPSLASSTTAEMAWGVNSLSDSEALRDALQAVYNAGGSISYQTNYNGNIIIIEFGFNFSPTSYFTNSSDLYTGGSALNVTSWSYGGSNDQSMTAI